jgi:hypothetical protein
MAMLMLLALLSPLASSASASAAADAAGDAAGGFFKASVHADLAAPLAPFPHTWKRSFGSGHAALGVRADYLRQLEQVSQSKIHIE